MIMQEVQCMRCTSHLDRPEARHVKDTWILVSNYGMVLITQDFGRDLFTKITTQQREDDAQLQKEIAVLGQMLATEEMLTVLNELYG